MRKFFCVGAIIAMLLGMCACGSTNETANSDNGYGTEDVQPETTLPKDMTVSEAFNEAGVWIDANCPGYNLERTCQIWSIVEFDGNGNARGYQVEHFGDWTFDDIRNMNDEELVEWAKSIVAHGPVDWAPYSLQIKLDGTGNATIAEELKYHESDAFSDESVSIGDFSLELDYESYTIYDKSYAGYGDGDTFFVTDVTDDFAVNYILDSPDSGIEIDY